MNLMKDRNKSKILKVLLNRESIINGLIEIRLFLAKNIKESIIFLKILINLNNSEDFHLPKAEIIQSFKMTI